MQTSEYGRSHSNAIYLKILYMILIFGQLEIHVVSLKIVLKEGEWDTKQSQDHYIVRGNLGAQYVHSWGSDVSGSPRELFVRSSESLYLCGCLPPPPLGLQRPTSTCMTK